MLLLLLIKYSTSTPSVINKTCIFCILRCKAFKGRIRYFTLILGSLALALKRDEQDVRDRKEGRKGKGKGIHDIL